MKFLICGSGSIGQRHCKNLIKLGHEVAFFRSGKTDSDFTRDFFESQGERGTKLHQYQDLELAINDFDPCTVIVATPNSKHIEPALVAARAGKSLFIEKPISSSQEGIEELKNLIKKNRLKIMVGYNLRWHPLLQEMRNVITKGAIGKPISMHVEIGENIADWHPWEEYQFTYAAHHSGGGGATLCFSHDIDYLYWFFGYPKKILAVGGHLTPLLGDADDMVKILYEYDNGTIASLHIDYWQRPHKRLFSVIGTQAEITWDYEKQTLTLTPHKAGQAPTTSHLPSTFDRNDMFILEISDFIRYLEDKIPNPIPLDHAIDVLDISLRIKSQLNC